MIIEEAVWTGAEQILAFFGNRGADIIVREAIQKLTPEDLGTLGKFCVEVAEMGAVSAAGSVVAAGIHKKMESTKKVTNFVIRMFDGKKEKEVDAKPVINTEENLVEIVEIPEDETPERDEHSHNDEIVKETE